MLTGDRSGVRSPESGPASATARAAVAVAAGLALGVLTAYAQGWLPAELGSLANSAGSRALAAFVLALSLAGSARQAALIGTLALLSLLAGYVIGGGRARG